MRRRNVDAERGEVGKRRGADGIDELHSLPLDQALDSECDRHADHGRGTPGPAPHSGGSEGRPTRGEGFPGAGRSPPGGRRRPPRRGATARAMAPTRLRRSEGRRTRRWGSGGAVAEGCGVGSVESGGGGEGGAAASSVRRCAPEQRGGAGNLWSPNALRWPTGAPGGRTGTRSGTGELAAALESRGTAAQPTPEAAPAPAPTPSSSAPAPPRRRSQPRPRPHRRPGSAFNADSLQRAPPARRRRPRQKRGAASRAAIVAAAAAASVSVARCCGIPAVGGGRRVRWCRTGGRWLRGRRLLCRGWWWWPWCGVPAWVMWSRGRAAERGGRGRRWW